MADVKDMFNERHQADELAADAQAGGDRYSIRVVLALLSIKAEIRALAMCLEIAHREGRNG